jgi:outer membrane protein TolC
MMRFKVLILATLISATPLLAAAQDEKVLTLDQAIAVALENNRSLSNARLDIAKARNQAAASRTYRLPSLNSYLLGARQLSHVDFKFDQGALGYLDGVGPVPAQDVTIKSSGRFSALFVNQITQPISQLHRIGLGIKQAETGIEIASEQLRAVRQSVIADVTKGYYAILQTQSSLHATQQNIQLYRELDRLTEQYVLQRVSLKSDSLDIKTRLAKTELDVLSLEDRLASQKEQLNSLLGRDIQEEFSVAIAPQAQLISIELSQARATALSQRPEIRQAKLKISQTELDKRSKRSEYIPDISLNISQTSPINYSDSLPKNLTTAGIAVSWNGFDWGRKKHELAVKQASVLQAENTLKDAETLVVREVNANFRKLQQTTQMLHVADLSQQAATEALRVTMNNYRVSAVLFKDVLQSQSAVEQANDQYQQALLSFWTAKSEFEKSLGEDHD